MKKGGQKPLVDKEMSETERLRMDFIKNITAEKLPKKNAAMKRVIPLEQLQTMTDEEIADKIEILLQDRMRTGDKMAVFQLGQFYFEQEKYSEAMKYFDVAAQHGDYQATFQLGVMLYDGLGDKIDYEKSVRCMKTVASLKGKKYLSLACAAQFNLGRAHLQGFGVQQSDQLAERYWLMAAYDGSPDGSIKAQGALGLFYTRLDSFDLIKASFWHSEACGNGNLESQGVLGVMYLYALGKPKDLDSAFQCLRSASERGSPFAMGHLASFYYHRKMFTKCTEIAFKAAEHENPEQIATELDLLPESVCKGIAIGSFYYARCLELGLGCAPDKPESIKYYHRGCQFDAVSCSYLQHCVQMGQL